MAFPAFSVCSKKKQNCVLRRFVFGDIQFDWPLCQVSWEVTVDGGMLTGSQWLQEIFSFLTAFVLLTF